MSAINTTTLTNGFSSAPGTAGFDFTAADVPAAAAGANDSISPLAGSLIGGAGSGFGLGTGYGGSSAGASSGLTGFNAIMNGFVCALQNVLTSLGQQFGFSPSSPTSPAQAETLFTSATASSTGDPHDAFDGTTSAGTSAAQSWDSMQSHADLLDSDSFSGGYRVATTVGAPDAEGVTLNASASVALDGGATNVTYEANGSFTVSSGGQNVSVLPGRSVSLGNGDSVSLARDGSLSISATNGSGGSLVTSFKPNGGGGVDVSATASDVALGGYLVTQSDAAPAQPTLPHRYTDSAQPAPITYAYAALDGSDLD